jgi:hypothetical protein
VNKTADAADLPAGLIIYSLYSEDGAQSMFRLSEGDHGYIMMTADETIGKTFIEPKHYYRPIPQTQLILNENLQQQEYWR